MKRIKRDPRDIGPEGYDKGVFAETISEQIDIYYFPKSEYRKQRLSRILKILEPQSGNLILDLGCGVGSFVFHSVRGGANCIGVDYSYYSLERASKLIKICDSKISPDDYLLVQADAAELPLKEQIFDKIVAADFFEHINLSQKKAVLTEIKRLLSNGGFCLIYTQNKFSNYLGLLYKRLRCLLTFGNPFKITMPFPSLHIGLTTTFQLRRLVRAFNYRYKFFYFPNRIPIIRKFKSLNNTLCTKILGLRDFLASEIVLIIRKG